MVTNKIKIEQARKRYGGDSESETIQNMAEKEGYFRIYKCRDKSYKYSHYVGSTGPNDPNEINVFMDPAILNAVAVYMDNCVVIAGDNGNIVGHEDSKHVWS